MLKRKVGTENGEGWEEDWKNPSVKRKGLRREERKKREREEQLAKLKTSLYKFVNCIFFFFAFVFLCFIQIFGFSIFFFFFKFFFFCNFFQFHFPLLLFFFFHFIYYSLLFFFFFFVYFFSIFHLSAPWFSYSSRPHNSTSVCSLCELGTKDNILELVTKHQNISITSLSQKKREKKTHYSQYSIWMCRGQKVNESQYKRESTKSNKIYNQ